MPHLQYPLRPQVFQCDFTSEDVLRVSPLGRDSGIAFRVASPNPDADPCVILSPRQVRCLAQMLTDYLGVTGEPAEAPRGAAGTVTLTPQARQILEHLERVGDISATEA